MHGSDEQVDCGLRVNPEYSEIETALYDPCAPGSRFGLLSADLPADLPEASAVSTFTAIVRAAARLLATRCSTSRRVSALGSTVWSGLTSEVATW